MNTIDCSAVVDEGSAGQPELDGTSGQHEEPFQVPTQAEKVRYYAKVYHHF